MTNDRPRLGGEKEIVLLAERLRSLKLGPGYVGEDDESLFALVRGLGDIEESCRSYCQTPLPRLTEVTDSDEARAALLEILQEFQHVVYHLADMELTRNLPKLYRSD